ncbi:hypothetical protein HOLleu_27137 [Holothuria leucospilota]|uniref:Uncharacterized protein n=1 Tax=Holothuria leucospilota TaxID=206669 RepID=A0A9Q1BQB3_HOLLE|nr:hypothetical protein HOLleu_27137 [Holothuria leucospilota]
MDRKRLDSKSTKDSWDVPPLQQRLTRFPTGMMNDMEKKRKEEVDKHKGEPTLSVERLEPDEL